MKKLNLLWLALAATVLPGCSDNSEKGPGWVDPDVPRLNDMTLSRSEMEVRDGMNDFGFDLMHQISENYDNVYKNGNGNISVSPVSAGLALAMAANSTSGNDASRIAQALHCDDIDALNTLSNKLIRSLTYNSDLTVRLANSVWFRNSYSLSEQYTQTLKDVFCARAFDAPFDNSTVGLINGWCADKTGGLINHVIDDISDEAVIYYINAIYAAGDWSRPFNPESTRTERFNGRDSNTEVAMMHASAHFPCAGDDKCTAVRLTFKGENASMIFILPDEDVSVEELASEMTAAYLNKLRDSMTPEYSINLGLPKFKLSQQAKLKDCLANLGIPDNIYLDKAGINRSVLLSTIHYTHTEVDEDGAKVAAVTVVGGDLADFPSESMTLTFDRPFLYFFCDDTTGAILMAGRICNL